MRIDVLSIIIISSVGGRGALESQCAGTDKEFIIINDLQVSSYTLMLRMPLGCGVSQRQGPRHSWLH